MKENAFESTEVPKPPNKLENEVLKAENKELGNLPALPGLNEEKVALEEAKVDVPATIEGSDGFPGKITQGERGHVTILRNNFPGKYDLYLEALKILGEHGKVSEKVAKILFFTKHNAEELKSLKYWDDLISILEKHRLNQTVALRVLSIFFRSIEKRPRPALTGSHDPRFSPKMEISAQAKARGDKHKRIGHT